MKRLIIVVSFCLLFTSEVYAQSTTVSGQVTDAGGQTWNNGRVIATFVPIGTQNVPYVWTGGAFGLSQQVVTGNLNGTGAYSISVPSSTAITPVGTKWLIVVYSNTTPQFSASTTITITGATQTVNFTPVAISVSASSGTSAYADSEVSATVGQTYYNLTTNLLRICTAATGSTCTAWTGIGGGSSFSTNNVIPKGDGATLVSSGLTDDGTTISTTEAIVTTGRLGHCTDNPSPGAWAPTWTAGHTYCLNVGTYTVAAAQAVNVANATVLCLTPAAIIQRTGTTDLFDISANNVRVEGCTIDGGSQTGAGTGPLIKITAGTGTVIASNYIQNAGNTSATSAILYMTGGSNAKFLKNVFLGTTSDPCIYINNTTASTTISDVLVDANYVALFNPGASAFTCFDQRYLLGGTLAQTARITWSNNVIYARGASANAIALHGDIDSPGHGLSNANAWINNKVVALNTLSDAFHWFGNYHDTFLGNIADMAGFVAGHVYSFGDTYHSTIKANIAKNSAGANGCFTTVDGGRSIYEGNICDGVAPAGQGFSFVAISGVMSNNIIANNIANVGSYFASAGAICFQLIANSGSFNTLDNQFVGNHCAGTGGASQIGFQLTNLAGTLSDNFLVGNFIQNVATGFSLGAGAANTHISETHFDTVTTRYSDSGTGTIIGIVGTVTNDNAGSGVVGQYISSTIATGSSVTLGTGTTSNVTSISLTAGDWDVSGALDFTFGATTSYTNLTGGISTTSATLGAQDSGFDFETPAAIPTAGADVTWPLPTVRLSLASTTTVYLVAQATFSVSTLKAYGTIRARRMR